jgi:hypothetical protein
MRVSKPLIYCNIAALAVNGCIVWLMAARVFPLVLGVSIFLGCLDSAVWVSCKVNNKLPKNPARHTFYSAPAENRRARSRRA